MKRITSFASVALALALALPISALAVEGDINVRTNASINSGKGSSDVRATSSIKAKLLETKEERNEIRNDIKDTRQEVKDHTQELRADLRVTLFGKIFGPIRNIGDRLERAIASLDNLAGRIGSRITKIQNAGGNVSKPQSMLVDAKIKIDIARTDVNAVKANIAANFNSNATTSAATSTLRTRWTNLKTLIRKADSSIQTAHKALQSIIPELRVGATTTASTTSSN